MRAICPNQSTLKKVELRCRKCGKLFRTKNIDYVGARTIFADEEDCAHGLEDLKVICPKAIDLASFQEELALYKTQNRDKEEVDRIFKYAYNKTLKDLGLTYK